MPLESMPNLLSSFAKCGCSANCGCYSSFKGDYCDALRMSNDWMQTMSSKSFTSKVFAFKLKTKNNKKKQKKGGAFMSQVGERWACIFDLIVCLFKWKTIKETNRQSVRHSKKNKKWSMLLKACTSTQ